MTGESNTGFFSGSNPYSNRTYKKRIEDSRKNLSTDQIRQNKNKRSAQRNKNRKRERMEAINSSREAWRSLTPQQQLAELDRRLGPGIGAGKQRARIKFLIENPPKKPEKVQTVVKTGHPDHPKKYHKKGKSFNRHQQNDRKNS